MDGTVAASAINDWVSRETSGRITSVVSPEDLDSYTRLAIANAIYLKGPWESRFDPARTQSSAFTRADGFVVTVPMMNQTLSTNYSAGTDFQAAELRYRTAANPAGIITFVVLNAGQFETFAQSLDATKLSTILGGMTIVDLALSVPRFQIDPATTNLRSALANLGMSDVFEKHRHRFHTDGRALPDENIEGRASLHCHGRRAVHGGGRFDRRHHGCRCRGRLGAASNGDATYRSPVAVRAAGSDNRDDIVHWTGGGSVMS